MLTICVTLLLDVPDDDASCYDAVNEILRDQQRRFAPESCLIDYTIGTGVLSTLDLTIYEEGEAFK